MARTTKGRAYKRWAPKYDEGFLVNYGCPRGTTGARRGRLVPNLAREYARTYDAMLGALVERAEERAEAAYVYVPECWECGVELTTVGVCPPCQYELASSLDWDEPYYDAHAYESEQAEWEAIGRRIAIQHVARAIVRTQVFPIS